MPGVTRENDATTTGHGCDATTTVVRTINKCFL